MNLSAYKNLLILGVMGLCGGLMGVSLTWAETVTVAHNRCATIHLLHPDITCVGQGRVDVHKLELQSEAKAGQHPTYRVVVTGDDGQGISVFAPRQYHVVVIGGNGHPGKGAADPQ